MFESIINFFKKIGKQDKEQVKSKDAAKERLHLVLMQDRANVSADFLDLMKQEIIEVIKKYIDVDENAIDVRLTNKANEDGTKGAPALYANIPIVSIKEEVRTGMARQKDTSNEKTQKKEEEPKKGESKKEEVANNKGEEDKKEEVKQTKRSKEEVKPQQDKNETEDKKSNKAKKTEKKEEVKQEQTKQEKQVQKNNDIKQEEKGKQEKKESKQKTKKEDTTKK